MQICLPASLQLPIVRLALALPLAVLPSMAAAAPTGTASASAMPTASSAPPAPLASAPAAKTSPGIESLRIGAYFQPAVVLQGDTEFNQDDEGGFQFRNARLTGEGRVPIDSLFRRPRCCGPGQ